MSAIATLRTFLDTGSGLAGEVTDAARECERRIERAPAVGMALRNGIAVELSPYMKTLLKLREENMRA